VFIVFAGKLSSIFNWAYNLLGGSIWFYISNLE